MGVIHIQTTKALFPIQKVRNFLLGQFIAGEETGRKVTPQETSAQMRDANDKKVFRRWEWLTVQQITSNFSKLAAMKRLGKLPSSTTIHEENNEEEVKVVLRTASRYNLRQRRLFQSQHCEDHTNKLLIEHDFLRLLFSIILNNTLVIARYAAV